MRRKLDDQEKKITELNISRMEAELEALDYELMELEYALDKKYPAMISLGRKRMVDLKKNQIPNRKMTIDILRDQVKNGVEPKTGGN